MDRVIYLAMTGAREITHKQATVANNLANIGTHGFRQELTVLRALPVVGEGVDTRAFVGAFTSYTDYTPGTLQQTGRALDVAVRGEGWIAVRDARDQEAYTRMGHLQVGPNGTLETTNGHAVLGDAGPLAVPPDQEIAIGRDGTVSAVPVAGNRNAVTVLGRIKLVNPETDGLARGEDGLFRRKSGEPAQADANVQLVSGALETSNVNPAEAMVSMVSLARQFEMQMRLLRTAEDNHRSADKMLSATA